MKIPNLGPLLFADKPSTNFYLLGNVVILALHLLASEPYLTNHWSVRVG